MAKVVVHRFESYDIASDQIITSRRYGTAESIESVGGAMLANTQIEVDSTDLGAEVPGMTARDFQPDADLGAPGGGFQTTVR